MRIIFESLSEKFFADLFFNLESMTFLVKDVVKTKKVNFLKRKKDVKLL